ncbi:MAG: MarR family transcriptional regulator [Hyphomicrobiales bacterium]|nr:MarR family transcriptional regulator [Hyphomicrobiales bacterium]
MPSEMALGEMLPEEAVRDAAHGGMDDVYSKPGHLIRRLQQIAVSVFAQECADHDITPVQYAALVAVRDNPGLDATRIAALVAFDRSTIGNVLERLEGKALIERRANPDDRRVKILKISRRGARLLDACEPAVLRAQDRMLDPLDARERKAFTTFMRRIIAQQDQPK